jgi:hypothetical protein
MNSAFTPSGLGLENNPKTTIKYKYLVKVNIPIKVRTIILDYVSLPYYKATNNE